MKEQIEEAAEKWAESESNSPLAGIQGFKAGANYTLEQTQPVIDELVRALEYAKRFVDPERCDVKYIEETLSKHKQK